MVQLSAELTQQLTYAFFILGCVYVGKLAWTVISFVLRVTYIYVLPELRLSGKLQRYGKWAVVTGCTDGIGREYARQLAAANLNVVLISRSAEKLVALQEEIESTYEVDTRIIAVDFGKQALIYDVIRIELRGLDIGILVNNVGTDFQYLIRYGEAQEDEPLSVLNCNTASVAQMTHIVLPVMLQKRRGLIVNVGSTLGLAPAPLEALYCATKSFVDTFSRSLSMEYGTDGIDVQLIMPCLVTTKLSGKTEASLFVKTPQSFVKSALKSIGRSSKCTGCLVHELQSVLLPWAFQVVPARIFVFIFMLVARSINQERRALAKKLEAARENAEAAKKTVAKQTESDHLNVRARKNRN